MDLAVRQTIEDCAAASHAGTRNFAEIVAALAARGVESYRADYRLRSTAYYLPSGETHAVELPVPAIEIGERFDQEAIVAAIRGSQAGRIKYPEFVELSMKAGCVGYVVWIQGKNVTYFGRRGEIHTEYFPGARP